MENQGSKITVRRIIVEDQKVNKITDSIYDNSAIISLYRTNTKLGEVTNNDIGVPDFKSSGIPNKTIYTKYCKDTIINILQNGGVSGFYYEERKSDKSENIKYDISTFVSASKNLLINMLDKMVEGRNIEYSVISNIITFSSDDTHINIIEKYKDSNIKYGVVDFDIKFKRNNKEVTTMVKCEIRSGQLCKPKEIIYRGDILKFNITSVVRLLR